MLHDPPFLSWNFVELFGRCVELNFLLILLFYSRYTRMYFAKSARSVPRFLHNPKPPSNAPKFQNRTPHIIGSILTTPPTLSSPATPDVHRLFCESKSIPQRPGTDRIRAEHLGNAGRQDRGRGEHRDSRTNALGDPRNKAESSCFRPSA